MLRELAPAREPGDAEAAAARAAEEGAEGGAPPPAAAAAAAAPPAAPSIKEMKAKIREAGLGTADLLERQQVVARHEQALARLAEAARAKKAAPAKAPGGRHSTDYSRFDHVASDDDDTDEDMPGLADPDAAPAEDDTAELKKVRKRVKKFALWRDADKKPKRPRDDSSSGTAPPAKKVKA